MIRYLFVVFCGSLVQVPHGRMHTDSYGISPAAPQCDGVALLQTSPLRSRPSHDNHDVYTHDTVLVQEHSFNITGQQDPFKPWPRSDGALLVGAVLFLLCYDILASRRGKTSRRGHLISLVIMVAASALYGTLVHVSHGWSQSTVWVSGYLLELILSMDNLFVFLLIFQAFAVPDVHVGKVLVVGVYGAALLRVVAFLFLSTLVYTVHWFNELVGILIILSGLSGLLGDDESDDHKDTRTERFFNWLLGSLLLDEYHEGRLFVFIDGALRLTKLFLVVIVLIAVDIIFAFDSVGAKTAQIHDVYINVSSTLMAMFSLRSAFSVLKDMHDHFAFLKYAVAAILVFIGSEMLVRDAYAIPAWVIFAVTVASLVAAVAASLISSTGRTQAASC